ncbi:MAG: hypothetical protein LBF80_04080 [Spirochaetaceae bacterium]|jgi:hypothetical protein|nr:hypothetical protein [Spirochaetaceae bacterium]
MLKRLGFVFTVVFFQATALAGQDSGQVEDRAGDAAAVVFPVYILLQTAAGGSIDWRPDWPDCIPVDAFDILNTDGAVSALTLGGGDWGDISLTVRRNERGLLTEFPVFLDDAFYQASAKFDSAGNIHGFTMAGENPLEIEFLAFENQGGEPSLARIQNGESWFFASISRILSRQNSSVVETWYDVDGNPLAVFTAELPRSYRKMFQEVPDTENMESIAAVEDSPPAPARSESHLYFDSMGNVTKIDTDGAVFEALYYGTVPHYWTHPALGHLALQWDEQGRLVRMAGLEEDDAPLDSRYEYEFDGRGAWTERREFRMKPELDVLIPYLGDTFRRSIEYSRR